MEKLFENLGLRFNQRNGGRARRIVKLGARKGDGAEMAKLELVGSELVKRAAELAVVRSRGRSSNSYAKASALSRTAKTKKQRKKNKRPRKRTTLVGPFLFLWNEEVPAL